MAQVATAQAVTAQKAMAQVAETQVGFVALARNPVPSGAIVGRFTAVDGVKIRFARWEATRGPRRGTVCLFNGRAEFIEKYFEVVADLRRRGFAVATMDWRGQGGSDRLLHDRARGHVKNFNQYDRDLVQFMKEIVLPDCPPPFVALGHSLGGNILLRSACNQGSWFNRIVLSAPMLEFAPEQMPLPYSVIRMATRAASMLALGGLYVPGGSGRFVSDTPFENNQLTSDLQRFNRNKSLVEAAPHLAVASPTMGWVSAACRSMAKIAAPGYFNEIKVPVLMVAAGEDKIVSTRQIEEFGMKLKVGTQLVLPRSRHEILQETDDIRQRFWAAFDAYLGVE